MRRLLVNTARPFIFSTAPPPPVGRRRRGRARSCSRPSRELVERLRANAATLRGGARRRGPRRRRLDGPRSCRSRSARPAPTMELCERALERGVFAQGIRPPTVPEGTSRLRFTVMATHRAGASCERRRGLVGAAAPRARHRRRAGGRARSPSARRARRRGHLRHRHRDRGRQDRRRGGDRPDPGRRGPPRRRLQAGRDRPRRDAGRAEPDHELLRRAAGSDADRRRDRALPLRPAGLPPPGARRWPARRSTRRAARGGRARGRGRRRCSSARASAACWCRWRPATWSATSPSTSAYPLVIARRARASARSTTPC